MKHRTRDDSFALAYDEQEVLRSRLAEFALQEESLKDQLVSAVRIAAPRLRESPERWDEISDDLLFGLETVLLRRGEAFALSVTTGQVQQVSAREVLGAVTEVGRSTGTLISDEQATAAIIEVLERPSDNVIPSSSRRCLHDVCFSSADARCSKSSTKCVLWR